MIWSRRRKSVHIGPTSVDWRQGDMAECIADHWPRREGADPKVGDRLMVSQVLYGDNGVTSAFCLTFIGNPDTAFDSRAFRKIVLTDTGADRKVGKRAPRERVSEPA